MAASSNIATQIRAYKVLGTSQGVAGVKRLAEKAGQTYLQGTPVQVEAASGFLIACAAIVSAATALIAGFSLEPGANLSSNGVAKTLTTGAAVPNQASAVVIPIGAPINDGTSGLVLASDDILFIGTVGNSNTAANATLAQTMVGSIFGLTKDAGNNFWYVDNFITTTAGGACVEVIELIDAVNTLNGKVVFKVTHAAQQLMV